MTPTLAARYTNETPRTRTRPVSRKNATSGWNQAPAIRPLANVSPNCAKMALVGVLLTGWTLAKSLGKAPFRPKAYHIRVLTFAVASDTARVDDMKAMRINHQPLPQSLRARARPGRSEDVWTPLMLLGPKPVMTPQ